MTATSLFENSDIVYTYTRAQAIEDGVLIDVTPAAEEIGFIVPVAVTQAVYDRYIQWNDEDSKRQTLQHEHARLRDILWMLKLQRKVVDKKGVFEFYCVPRSIKSKRRSALRVILKSSIHGGDEGEPVITIMLPNED